MVNRTRKSLLLFHPILNLQVRNPFKVFDVASHKNERMPRNKALLGLCRKSRSYSFQPP